MAQDLTLCRCIGENGADKCVCSPEMVTDNFTAAKIKNIKTKVVESIICLKQGGVGMGTKELKIS